MLWAHAAHRERRLIVEPDSEGQIKRASGGISQADLVEKASRIVATATRAHYNRDLQIQLAIAHRCDDGAQVHRRQGLAVGRLCENPEHEYAFALWCNSTLGLLMHWWKSNKTQSGRGTTSVTGIPNIPTLDTRAAQTRSSTPSARAAFEAMGELRFLPFDQIDEDLRSR